MHQWRSPPPASYPCCLLLVAGDMEEKLRRMLGAVWLLRSMHLNTETYKNTEDYRNAENYRKIRPGSWSSVASSRYNETGESVLRQENFKGAGKLVRVGWIAEM